MQTRTIAAADFDRDFDIDLWVTDFNNPVYLENQGPSCWQNQNTSCLTDCTQQPLATSTVFDGKIGAKNYFSIVEDFNLDGWADTILQTANENILYFLEP